MTLRVLLCVPLLAALSCASAAPVVLGSYVFDSAGFGDTLIHSDGGTWATGNWLNTVNADPGSPGYLTGASFETGVGNMGIAAAVSYTIGYSAGIANGPGTDLGVVVARYSVDQFQIAFSLNGVAFTPRVTVQAGTAHPTGVSMVYYYGGNGKTLAADLYIHEIDLSDYGFVAGAVVKAVSITEGAFSSELDLIRVAQVSAVPEAETWALMVSGLAAIGFVARRRRR